MSNIEVLTAALRFAAVGCSVVPVMADGSKRPGIGQWKEYQSKLPTVQELQTWFADAKGVGVITGKVSGNLEMLELEGRAVADGIHQEIKQMAVESGLADLWQRLNDGYCEMTPSGGLHWFYRLDGQVPGNTKLARRPAAGDGVDVLAETRGEGGFVVAAPTGGACHPSGGSWSLISGSIETIPTLSLDEREALHSLFRYFDQLPKASVVASEVTERQREAGSTLPGDDFNERSSWDELLLPLGWTKIFAKGQTTAWCRPGKTGGISATTNYEGSGLLFVFSTSTIFEAERGYSKFAAYTLIEHAGDFHKAASALAAKGFGTNTHNSLQPIDVSALLEVPASDPGVVALPEPEPDTSWLPRVVEFEDEDSEPGPSVLYRTDGQCLLYAGKINAIFGESESGKTWVALEAVRQQLVQGNKVFYIDFEDSKRGIRGRLKALGVPREHFARFKYANPDGAYNETAQQALLGSIRDFTPDLIVMDGVNAAMNLLGLDLEKNKDATQFSQVVLRPLRLWGAAVLTIDHVTKSKDTRGNYAIGAQAKRADIDGVAISVDVSMPFGRGSNGKLSLKVTKDRPGFVRGMSQEASYIGHVDLISQADNRIEISIVGGQTGFTPHEYLMRKLSEFMEKHAAELSTNQIVHAIEGGTDQIKKALSQLEGQGYLGVRASGQGRYFTHIRPFILGAPVPFGGVVE
ncbi:Prim_Pol domain containing protein [uncultured Caudovirales phage]|uniref:Prim_Pol domain containing protein n=1 Tax=uncultured Caudovirales phage TaxID=2100421 RepID=A0A6J5Q5R7_9CAUD|nr:Prim_Pol domain containing protein [uncultured Caudovirales phage]CAB4202641.1 Prim_Pol domain containing protein [uncultured Caudovirales phage]CAB4214006.1 Prim_Pol domain containing protein [uncultured Caudovirales phage]CAB5228638.1 Prim_Pol domain containing protein [uncultured Caudovirales phage]